MHGYHQNDHVSLGRVSVDVCAVLCCAVLCYCMRCCIVPCSALHECLPLHRTSILRGASIRMASECCAGTYDVLES